MNFGFALKWWRRWRFDWTGSGFSFINPLVPVCCTRPGHFLLYLIKMFICTRKMQSSLSLYSASYFIFIFFLDFVCVNHEVFCVWCGFSFFLSLFFGLINKSLHHTCWHTFFQVKRQMSSLTWGSIKVFSWRKIFFQCVRVCLGGGGTTDEASL